MSDRFRLVTLDPGHFHAALIQKEMYPGVSPRVSVYAPLGPDLTEHLNRIARFNLRTQNPTAWELDVHTSNVFLQRMLAEKPGNVVVLSGRNRGKIGLIRASVEGGLNVLADKPWIIRPQDLTELEATLAAAARSGMIAYDIMTERYEITSILQRELVNDPEIFGTPVDVYMESVHHILKVVAGVPNLRPVWFFDVLEQGEALADVGTHLVDLAQWTLFPNQAINYRADIVMQGAKRWPTPMTVEQFGRVTGRPGGPIEYYCNTQVSYTLRGIPVKLEVLWNWEAPAGGGDTHLAIYRGTKSSIEVRQGKEENYQPELYVVADDTAARAKVFKVVAKYSGVGVEEQGSRLRVTIPAEYRVGHEAHFAQVARQFFEYLDRPETFPEWENPNMLAKYYVSTKGVEMSQ